jgi:hypothetical protein
VNAGQPKDQHLTKVQVNHYFMACMARMRRQAADDLDEQGNERDEVAARAVACAGAMPRGDEDDHGANDLSDGSPPDEAATRAKLGCFLAAVSSHKEDLRHVADLHVEHATTRMQQASMGHTTSEGPTDGAFGQLVFRDSD